MRLIDADALMGALYHRALETDKNIVWQSGFWARYRAIEQVVKAAPTVDACAVIRCKDCKWYGEPGCAIRIVDDTDKPSDMDFCSFAERKEGE